MPFSYFSKGITQTKPDESIDINRLIALISGNTCKSNIEQLRRTDDKKQRNQIKRSLGYVTVSGVFSQRGNDYLQEHSGLICMDFDDLEKPDDVKDTLAADPHSMALFISPSGNGLKVIVPIDATNHLGCFKALEDYYRKQYQLTVDPSGKDVARATYLSYDPEALYNPNAKAIEPLIDHKIDYDTGEVIAVDPSKYEDLDPRLDKKLKRAWFVIQQIEEAQLDLTANYDTWTEMGMALATFGEAGRELWHRLSQYHSDYKPRECDYKFDNFLKTTRFTSPAKFFKEAKTAGLQTSFTNTLPPGNAEGAEGVDYEDFEYKLPEGVELTPELKSESAKWGFIEHKHEYWFAKYDFANRRIDYHSISNYVIRPLFHLVSRKDPKRLFEIINVHGVRRVIELTPQAMVSTQKFYEMVEGQGDFLMDATKSQFHKIKKKIYYLTRTAEEIKILGWQKSFYAFANGAYFGQKFHKIDENGIVKLTYTNEEGDSYDRHYYIPMLSPIYMDEEEEYTTEKNFFYKKRDVTWKDYAEDFHGLYGDHAVIAIPYYIAALYRDLIYRRFKFFPHLFGFGPKGTGKSRLGWSLTYLFGTTRKPFNLNSGTLAGFFRTFAQFRNAVVWFDEYKNTIDFKRVEALKNAYDGAGHMKGDWNSGGNNTKTTSTPINSACYISGQDRPVADVALFSRCILLEFFKTDYTIEERQQSDAMQDMEEKGLSHFTAGFMTFRQDIESQFDSVYDTVYTELHELANQLGHAETRLISNYSILLTVYKILQDKIYWPYTYKEMLAVVVRNITAQQQHLSNSGETNQFWDTVSYLFLNGSIADESDFCIKHLPEIKLRINRNETALQRFTDEKSNLKPKKLLFISLSKIHPMYMKSMREQGEKKGMDRGSLVHYLQHSIGYIGAVDKINFGNRKSSAYVFDYKELERACGINLEKAIPGEPDDTEQPKAE